MGDEQYRCTLADACEAVNYGLTASASSHSIGPRFLRITDIVPGYVDWSTVPYVAEDNHLLTKYALDDGDIVIARTGASTGASAYLNNPPPAVFASYLVRLKVKPEFDARYVSFFLKSPMFLEYIRGILGDKSAQPNASASTMTAAPLCVPRDKSVQRAIAHILGTLEDKIELNRRMNETLEAMARALFRSWFVEFEPVRAKAEGRGPGLPCALGDIFPSRFVDSELGEVPEGWEAGTTADLSDLNPEAWTKKTRPTEIRYVDLSNTKRGRIEAIAPYTAARAPSRAQRVLRPGDTIVGTVRPGNGSYALVSELGLTGSTGFAVLRPKAVEYAEFVYLAATSAGRIDALAHLADGAAYPAVRPDVVAATPVVRPDGEVLTRFSSAAGALLGRIAHAEEESHTLASLRDLLLPKLISGEVRLRDAEKVVKTVA